jgi:putative membrane protein
MVSVLAANAHPWRWQPHPEVLLIVVAALTIGLYVTRVIGPKVVPAGQPVVTGAQRGAYLAAVAVLWLASDWPLHDISEEYLYSAHMVQHFLLSLVVPPLLLAATPQWLARLVVGGTGHGSGWIKRLAHPLVAGFLYNVVVATTHATTIVNTSADIGAFHYLVHLAVFTSSLLMWVPVVGPLPELRLNGPLQMVYLFMMSVIPTVPAAWLTFADRPVYSTYDHGVRLFGLSVTEDQQAAGVFMKLVAGGYLWVWIAARFFGWSAGHYRRMVSEREIVHIEGTLTTADVAAEFERTPARPG